MATGDRHIRIYSRKEMSFEAMTNFYNSLKQNFLKAALKIYPVRGIFTGGGAITPYSSNTISISSFTGITNEGNYLDIANQTVVFENLNGIPYYFGVHQIEIEVPDPLPADDGIEIAPIPNQPRYIYLQENVGVTGSPNTVYDNGDTSLTIVVNAVTGTTNCGGRTVRVWLNTPLSIDNGFYEDCTVVYGTTDKWIGSKNYIITTGNLHQVAVLGASSTTETDYRVWFKGITVSTTDISSDTDYVYLGKVAGTGGVITTGDIDQTEVHYLFINTITKSNLFQLAKDLYGDDYVFTDLDARTDRSYGTV